MLKLDGFDFTQGCSIYVDHRRDAPEPTAKIFVRLLVGENDTVVYAQLDTGAAWSVLDPSIARTLGLFQDGDPAEEARLDTRFGTLEGRLVRLPIRFVADRGISFDTEGTFFISPDCPEGRTFLGYSGLLDAMRFALDPRSNHFYFGA